MSCIHSANYQSRESYFEIYVNYRNSQPPNAQFKRQNEWEIIKAPTPSFPDLKGDGSIYVVVEHFA